MLQQRLEGLVGVILAERGEKKVEGLCTSKARTWEIMWCVQETKQFGLSHVCVVGKGAATDKAHLNPKAGSRFGRCIILKGL